MVEGIDAELTLKAFRFFCGAPGSSPQPFEIIANHRESVIERKEDVISSSLQFALSDDATSPALVGLMGATGKVVFDIFNIVWILVAPNDRIFADQRLQIPKEPGSPLSALIFPWAVLFPSKRG